jgi:S1-C subfamily serine protease/predicted Fe-Mo cluster-binding NifX family protein
LINDPTFSSGLGKGQIQLINDPTTFSSGLGKGQIQLINQNRPGGPYLGLNLSEVNKAVAQEVGVPAGSGVYINTVVAMSPGQKAGLKAGDVLLKCDHKTVNTPEQVGQILGKKKAGDVIKVVVNRNGRKKSLHVKLENAPMGLNVGATQNPVWMGADIQNVDAVMKIKFNLPDTRGVIVSHVVQGSPAQDAGLRTGDAIRRFGATRIRDVKQFQSMILASQPGQNAQLTILRNGRHETVEVTMARSSPNTGRNVPFLGPADVAIEGSWIGMDVTELSPGDVSAIGLPSGTMGILVNDVESPPATLVGFQTGDVIVAVGGTPTPDMKQFEAATQKQSGAVVDVIRGSRHLFVTVPPPGFTQQGTQLNTGLNNKMRQVAMTKPVSGRVAILSSGQNLNSSVTRSTSNFTYLIMVDLQNNSYAVVDANSRNRLTDIFQQYNITDLVCSDISHQMATSLASMGVVVYSGVVGTAWDALGLYETNRLISMKSL